MESNISAANGRWILCTLVLLLWSFIWLTRAISSPIKNPVLKVITLLASAAFLVIVSLSELLLYAHIYGLRAARGSGLSLLVGIQTIGGFIILVLNERHRKAKKLKGSSVATRGSTSIDLDDEAASQNSGHSD